MTDCVVLRKEDAIVGLVDSDIETRRVLGGTDGDCSVQLAALPNLAADSPNSFSA